MNGNRLLNHYFAQLRTIIWSLFLFLQPSTVATVLLLSFFGGKYVFGNFCFILAKRRYLFAVCGSSDDDALFKKKDHVIFKTINSFLDPFESLSNSNLSLKLIERNKILMATHHGLGWLLTTSDQYFEISVHFCCWGGFWVFTFSWILKWVYHLTKKLNFCAN